jgi:hypothetical protein
MKKPSIEDLKNRFYYHRPDQVALDMHQRVNDLTFELAVKLTNLLPEGRNLSLVLTHLEDARMRANAAIACDRVVV